MKKIFASVFILGILLGTCFSSQTSFAFSSKKAKNAGNFTLESISPYVVQNSPIDINIRSTTNNGKFRIEVLKPTNTQSELYNFTSNLGLGKVKDSIEVDLTSTSTNSDLTFNFNTQIPVNGDPATTLQLSNTGIFPIAISQIDQNNNAKTKYSFVTNIPSISSNGAAYSHRLNLVPLLKYSPLIDRSSLQNQKTLDKTYNKLITAQSVINGVSTGGYQASVLLSADTLNAYKYIKTLKPNSAGESTLFPVNVGSNIEYISDTYVPINFAELEKQDLTSHYEELLALARTKITEQGFISPSRTLVSQAVTNSSVENLTKSGIDNVIVDDDTLPKDERPKFGPSVIQNGDSKIRIAAADTQIMENMPKNADVATQANYLISALNVIMLESPSLERGFILPINLETISKPVVVSFLTALSNNPVIKTITTQDFFNVLKENKTISRKLSKYKEPKKINKSASKNDVLEVEKLSAAAKSLYEQNSISYIQAEWMNVAIFSRSDIGTQKIVNKKSANNLIKEAANLIALPQKRTLTITSHQSTIPVTIKNTSSQNINVIVTIDSNKLSFPKASRFKITLKSQNTTVKIPVRAKTSGSFPVTIKVLTPKNSVSIVEQSATVRSTAFSGVGLFIAIGALIFLSLWWATHIRKTKSRPIARVIEITKENVG
ncbi:MAG: DUF6049 family protein [Acidimicrobiia bacterium]